MIEAEPINFHEAIESSNSHKWIDTINEESKSMKDNDVYDLIPLPLVTYRYLRSRWIQRRSKKV